MRMLGQTPSEDEVSEIIKDFAEGDTMALEEFLDFMARQLNGASDKREEDLSKEFKLLLKETFRWYDTDADGIISWDELKMALKNTGEKIEEWEIEELMKDGDENMDKRIDFDEWINMMKELEGQVQCLDLEQIFIFSLTISIYIVLTTQNGYLFKVNHDNIAFLHKRQNCGFFPS
uniref:EF-hand domain-containing protein n=2 Tax=Ciona savignyi TaxID=51511 RepID=H2YR51_CIOSA